MTETSVQSTIELGRLLAAAQGYKVFAHNGAPLGALERIRYEQQVSHPGEIVVCGRRPFHRRRRTFPFDAVGAVNERQAHSRAARRHDVGDRGTAARDAQQRGSTMAVG